MTSFRTIGKESTEAYAQRRANETGCAYIVTNMGHAFMDCAMNRKLAREDCDGIAHTYRPAVKHLTD